jgi:putative N6-adenine-specific DNA methylase
VDASTTRCRLYHTGALAETVGLAIQDAIGPLPERADPAGDDQPLSRLVLRGEADHFTLSVDSSGELLHKRGYRVEAGAAPLRETLAAAILALCDYDPALPFLDPMCGSGTFSIEAAAIAAGLPPGRGRTFAFCDWPVLAAPEGDALREAAGPPPTGPFAPILASDRDPRMVETARRNAARAGVQDRVDFRCASLGEGAPSPGPGLLLLNPPYGHRLGDPRALSRHFRALGQTLRAAYPGVRLAVLCPSQPALDALAAGYRARPGQTHGLRNGGLRILLAIWDP